VETRTNEMWTKDFRPNPTNASTFARTVPAGKGLLKLDWSQEGFGPRKIEGLPFDNWALPRQDDLRKLISGRGSLGGVTYLQREARMNTDQLYPAGSGGLAFMAKQGGWDLVRLFFISDPDVWELQIKRFYLGDGHIDSSARPLVHTECVETRLRCDQTNRRELEPIKGVAVYVRDLGPNESYFWK
jgi:hypothetical protein